MKKKTSDPFSFLSSFFLNNDRKPGKEPGSHKFRWHYRIPYPILLPLSISSFLISGAAKAQSGFLTVFQEDFSHCRNAWNSSKAAVSERPDLEFSGKVYSSRKCVKMASSGLSGRIAVTLPVTERKPSDIRLILRGARFDKEKPSRIYVLSYGARVDTLHFRSFYKDKDSEPYSENDSMTQSGKDFSSYDTLSIRITGSFPPDRISLQSDADDQCFVDRIKVEYRYAQYPGCDLPGELKTEPHPVISAWLKLSWKESTECFLSRRIIRIDSGQGTCREFFWESGEKPEIELKDLRPGGTYTARAGRSCPDGILRFSESIEFRFPEKDPSAMYLEILNDTLVFEGKPGDFLQKELRLKGENINKALAVHTTGSQDLYCFPTRIEPSDWKSDTFPLTVGYTISHFPLSGNIRILSGEPENLLFEIPVLSTDDRNNPERLTIVKPAIGQIYPERNVCFSFLTENFVPGRDGKIAIELQDTTFHIEKCDFSPPYQPPGFHTVRFFLTNPEKEPLAHTLQTRTYLIEALPDTVPDPQPDSTGCKPPLYPEIIDIDPSSVHLAWVHNAPVFLVEVRDLFGFESVLHTDRPELHLDYLQQGYLYAWKVAAVCPGPDTSAWIQGPDFEIPARETSTGVPPVRILDIRPNPCHGNCFVFSSLELSLELYTSHGGFLYGKRIPIGKSPVRFPGKGAYFLLFKTPAQERIIRKVVVL